MRVPTQAARERIPKHAVTKQSIPILGRRYGYLPLSKHLLLPPIDEKEKQPILTLGMDPPFRCPTNPVSPQPNPGSTSVHTSSLEFFHSPVKPFQCSSFLFGTPSRLHSAFSRSRAGTLSPRHRPIILARKGARERRDDAGLGWTDG